MTHSGTRNLKVGIFVVAGLALLVLGLYFIGSKQNLFGSTFRLFVRFHDVGGLMQGNNVRFAGIDVGTVSSVDIENDTTVIVELLVEKKVQRFIRKNSVARVGTDGLMGNRLVSIENSAVPSEAVEDGDALSSVQPLEIDEMVRTLGATNDNIRVVTDNLRAITGNAGGKNSIWGLLSDTSMAIEIRNALGDFRTAAANTKELTRDAGTVADDIRRGEGIGKLLRDSALPADLSAMAKNLHALSDSARVLTYRLNSLAAELQHGKGAVSRLIHDTLIVRNLNKTIIDLDSGAVNFNRNMEALKYSWPFRKGFKKHK